MTAVTVEPLAFPKVGADTAAYRATITAKFKTGTTKLIRDFVFFSNGRLELSLTVDAPTPLRARLVGFEAEMARMLVRRGRAHRMTRGLLLLLVVLGSLVLAAAALRRSARSEGEAQRPRSGAREARRCSCRATSVRAGRAAR